MSDWPQHKKIEFFYKVKICKKSSLFLVELIFFPLEIKSNDLKLQWRGKIKDWETNQSVRNMCKKGIVFQKMMREAIKNNKKNKQNKQTK